MRGIHCLPAAAPVMLACSPRVTPAPAGLPPCSRGAMDDALRGWRADTPGCSHRNHLNNAGAALTPSPVLAAMTEHLQLEATIGGYEAADARASAVEQVYADVARLVRAEPRNVAIVANATAGFVQSLSSFDLAPGDAIVTTRSDYTSNQIQYLALAKRLGVTVLHADDLPEGGVDPDSVRDLARRARCPWSPCRGCRRTRGSCRTRRASAA